MLDAANNRDLLGDRCLLARTLNAAAGVLDAEVMEIDPARTSTTARDFLSYCYYGGMVHMGAFTVRQPPGVCPVCYTAMVRSGTEPA